MRNTNDAEDPSQKARTSPREAVCSLTTNETETAWSCKHSGQGKRPRDQRNMMRCQS
jgi:hypothetical protein